MIVLTISICDDERDGVICKKCFFSTGSQDNLFFPIC